jgi:hypothetical protein
VLFSLLANEARTKKKRGWEGIGGKGREGGMEGGGTGHLNPSPWGPGSAILFLGE